MEREPAGEVSELLGYEDHTAAGMMGTRYFAQPVDATVGQVLQGLRGERSLLKRLTHVFLIDADGRLQGSVPLGRLAVAGSEEPAISLAFKETLQIEMDAKQDEVIESFDKYNLYALPVVDEQGRLQGTITADDVIARLSPEIERGL